jgi:hypothetical protein
MDESLKARRGQLLIDADLQGTLIKRVILYWFLALLSFAIAVVFAKLLAGTAIDSQFAIATSKELVPAFVVSLLPLPFILRDVLRVSHRYAGPMLRIRRGIAELAREGKSTPISARKGDAWPECIADFNKLADR